MKLRIDNSAMLEEFFESTSLFGIVAPIKSYHFCWLLNQQLRIDFRTNQDLEIQLEKKGRKYFFTIYNFVEEGKTREHFLYENQFDGEYLLPEFKHLDYIWLIRDPEMKLSDFANLQNQIRHIDNVQMVVEVNYEMLKNKINLII